MADTMAPRHSMDPPIRHDWLAQWDEPILDPDLPIVDPHHHLWDVPDWDTRYLLDDLLADLRTGHNIVATVFLQCWSMHRSGGPEALQPVGVRITAAGRKGYVALGPANRVAVFDTATYEVKDYLLVGQRVWQLGFSPDGRFLYTTNGNSNDISIIDVEKDKVVKSVQVGEQPWGVVAVEL